MSTRNIRTLAVAIFALVTAGCSNHETVRAMATADKADDSVTVSIESMCIHGGLWIDGADETIWFPRQSNEEPLIGNDAYVGPVVEIQMKLTNQGANTRVESSTIDRLLFNMAWSDSQGMWWQLKPVGTHGGGRGAVQVERGETVDVGRRLFAALLPKNADVNLGEPLSPALYLPASIYYGGALRAQGRASTLGKGIAHPYALVAVGECTSINECAGQRVPVDYPMQAITWFDRPLVRSKKRERCTRSATEPPAQCSIRARIASLDGSE